MTFSYGFYQKNIEKRFIAREILALVLPLKPDFLLLGADSQDVFDGLSTKYTNSFLSFSTRHRPKNLRSSRVDENSSLNHSTNNNHIHATTMTQPYQLPSVDTKNMANPATNGSNSHSNHHHSGNVPLPVPVVNSVGSSSVGNNSEDYEDDLLVFEERGVIFEDGDEDFIDNHGDGNSDNPPPQFLVHGKRIEPREDHHQVTSNSIKDDYENDSFIIEDNDEGDNSLSASPFISIHHNQPTNSPTKKPKSNSSN